MPESTRKTQMRSSSTGARPGSSMMARGKAHEDITAIADRLKAPSDAEQARLSNKCKKEHDSCVYAPHASAVYISERVLLSDQQTVQAIEPTSGTGLEWPNLDRQMLMKRILRCFWPSFEYLESARAQKRSWLWSMWMRITCLPTQTSSPAPPRCEPACNWERQWFPDPDAPPATALDTVVWRRVSGALYLPNGKLPKIVQVKTVGMGGV
eukprot:scaffold47710_cov16-Tisochrysis_lutea.AAC.2